MPGKMFYNRCFQDQAGKAGICQENQIYAMSATAIAQYYASGVLNAILLCVRGKPVFGSGSGADYKFASFTLLMSWQLVSATSCVYTVNDVNSMWMLLDEFQFQSR